jgi:hypothetical protein
MSLDLTSFDAALKDLYTDQDIKHLSYKDNPFHALVSKMESFYGRQLPVVLQYGNPQNRSATFATGQAQTSTSKVTEFSLTRARDYSFAFIDNETLEASKSDKGAFLSAAKVEMDGALESLSRSLAIAEYGTGSGTRGQVNAEPSENASTFSITLKNINDVTNFEVGQVVVIYSAETGGSIRTSDGTDDEFPVAGVNRDTGVLTLTGTYDSSGTIAANDYIFAEGDRGNMIKGLRAWLPDSAPSSTAFFGVDRSVDPTRLGGIRYNGSSESIEEALISAAARCAREGGKPDVCFMNYNRWAELEKALGSKVQYVDVKGPAEVGFRGIQIIGPRGPIKVIPDANCPSDRAFMLTMSTWKLYSLHGAPHIDKTDSLSMLRQSNADGVEVRMRYWAQLGCSAPGWNVNIQLA